MAKELRVTFSKLGTASKLAKYNGQGDEVGVDGVVKHHGHSGQCHGRGGSVVAVVIPLCDHEAFDLRINCR